MFPWSLNPKFSIKNLTISPIRLLDAAMEPLYISKCHSYFLIGDSSHVLCGLFSLFST